MSNKCIRRAIIILNYGAPGLMCQCSLCPVLPNVAMPAKRYCIKEVNTLNHYRKYKLGHFFLDVS